MIDFKKNINLIVFDWGNTLMRDYPDLSGPMYLWDYVECIEGAPQILDYLNGKYKLCIATSAGVSDTSAMRKALARVGIEHYFNGFFSSKELGVAKPDPKFFLKICREMQETPNKTLMIGNDYQKDICGAHQAGLHTLFFEEEYTEKELTEGTLACAEGVIHHLIELKNLL